MVYRSADYAGVRTYCVSQDDWVVYVAPSGEVLHTRWPMSAVRAARKAIGRLGALAWADVVRRADAGEHVRCPGSGPPGAGERIRGGP